MRFRYKVLFINIMLLSLALGAAGYLMIQRNFELARNTQLQNAIVENNILQASVEYELLQVINGNGSYSMNDELTKIGSRVASGLSALSSSFYIKYGDDYAYSYDGHEYKIIDALFENISVGGKNYVMTFEEGRHYIYVTSYSTVNDKAFCVVSKRDISEAYSLMDSQIAFYRMLVLVIVAVGGMLMYGFSVYLTRPLEKLNRITDEIIDGNYDVHMEVRTDDEIGLLTDKFNRMSNSVAEHVDELNDMIHRRDQFVADFTHEIKTPMTTIIGYADTMRSIELSREEQIMALNYIFSEGRRLERMSAKLFELIYLKQHDIELLPVHVTDLSREIVSITEPALNKKNITFATDIEPAVVLGSRELLVNVFINLIDNARKASADDSRISFTGSFKDGDIYEFCVTDNGTGMSKEDAARICDEFYMADKSRSRKEGGAGLGMSLVAMILERHGATLEIESELGKGTVMRVGFVRAETDDGCDEEDYEE